MFRYFTDFVTVMCSETGQILPQNLVVRPKRPTNPSKEKLSYQRCFHFEVRLAHFTGKPRIRGQSDQIFNQELVYVFICKDFIHFGGGDLGDNNSRVSEMKFTCSYDRYRPTYICWWVVAVAGNAWDLGLCAPSNHHQRIWVLQSYTYHRSRY